MVPMQSRRELVTSLAGLGVAGLLPDRSALADEPPPETRSETWPSATDTTEMRESSADPFHDVKTTLLPSGRNSGHT